MKVRIQGMREEQVRQLTGCRYAVVMTMCGLLARSIHPNKLGAPFRRSVATMVVAALVRLRSGNPHRSLAIQLGIPHVTLRRYVNLVCDLLARLPLLTSKDSEDRAWLAVDSTCVRVRSVQSADYSGYKHHKNRKAQVIVDDRRRIVAASDAHPGAVHDKTIRDGEFEKVEHLLDRPTLGDKAYAGGKGEGAILFRPIKRNETAWKTDKDECRSSNRELSKKRVRIEHVFARMKTFRILRDMFPCSPDRFGSVFKAIAYIHNLIMAENGD